MAPAPRSRSGFDDKADTLTVLVTGFGPFMEQFPVNPSFEIAKRLPEKLPGSETRKTIRIIVHPMPVRVAFDDVRDLIPKLHDEYYGKVDIVLHIGMASGNKFYELERCAHRDGYNKNKDIDGKMPPRDQGKKLFGDCPETMLTSLKYDEVFKAWQRNVHDIPEGSPGYAADLQPSNDAGHYLCDYIYFQSLAYFARKSGSFTAGKDADRPILFFHVPAESDEKTLATGQAVATNLIQAFADVYAKPLKNGNGNHF